MALKRKITKEVFEKLSKDLQSEYKSEGENYYLDIEGGDDISTALRAKDYEKKRANEAEEKANKLAADMEALKTSHTSEIEKFNGKLAETEAKIGQITEKHVSSLQAKDAKIQDLILDNTVSQISNKHFSSPSLINPVIKSRLIAEFGEDGTPQIKVKGADGKPSDMKIEDLTKELLANPEYEPIIIGSKASGSGTPSSQSTPPGGAGAGETKIVNLANLDAKSLVAHLNLKKEE